MGTKSTTQTTNQYSPAGTAAYNTLIPQATATTTANLTNPYGNQTFLGLTQQGKTGAAAGGAALKSGNASNAAALLGSPPSSAASNYTNTLASMTTAGNTARSTNSLIQGAASTRNQALASAMNFRPLQTGGTSVQQTSGLGTWLPQVMGMGMAAVTGGLSGGLGGAATGAVGASGVPGASAASSMFSNPNSGNSFFGNVSSPSYAGGYNNNGQIGQNGPQASFALPASVTPNSNNSWTGYNT
jgi:hypothetical protein